jgi:hypothetical protein
MFSAIWWWEQVTFGWDDDDVHLVLIIIVIWIYWVISLISSKNKLFFYDHCMWYLYIWFKYFLYFFFFFDKYQNTYNVSFFYQFISFRVISPIILFLLLSFLPLTMTWELAMSIPSVLITSQLREITQ